MKTLHLLLFFTICFRANAQSIENKTDDSPIYTTVETFPTFPGGSDSLKAYVMRHVIYPAIYRRFKYEEKVFVNFVVEKDGSLSNVKLLQGSFGQFEKAALNLVKNMPRWNPGTQDGKLIRVYVTLPVGF